jgi:carboxyl-terminal processing protease
MDPYESTTQNETNWFKAPLLVGGVLVVVAFVSGLYIGVQQSEAGAPVFAGSGSEPPADVDLTPLWKTWNAIIEKYVPASTTAPITSEQMVYGAAQGLAESLGDPYTVFLPPKESEVFQEDIRGNFEGVGMEIGVRGEALVVISPLKGTPAERAGIQSGDRIMEIDGTSTEGMTVDEAVQRIRGERGTVVELTIARKGSNEFLTIPVTRDVISIPTIQTELRPDGVFVIRLFNFSALSPGLFRGALREFIETDSTQLVFDLRGNPGGFLEAAIDMASWFLPSGKVVVTEDFGNGDDPRIHRSKGYNVFNENLEMVVLVNQGSASASEILAGALQEHGLAILVGTKTFGKGSVQELVNITDNTSLKVTVARWLTPNGRSLSENGLEPNITIEVTQEDIDAGRDPQLERAVRFLLTGQ